MLTFGTLGIFIVNALCVENEQYKLVNIFQAVLVKLKKGGIGHITLKHRNQDDTRKCTKVAN